MRKALKTVLCVALILALTAIVALRVLPPMDTPAQSAAATPTPVVTAAPTPTPEPDNGLPKVNTGSWELTLVNAQNPIGEAVPEDLAELEGGRYFDGRAVDALKEFIAAARAEGLSVCRRQSPFPIFAVFSRRRNAISHGLRGGKRARRRSYIGRPPGHRRPFSPHPIAVWKARCANWRTSTLRAPFQNRACISYSSSRVITPCFSFPL